MKQLFEAALYLLIFIVVVTLLMWFLHPSSLELG